MALGTVRGRTKRPAWRGRPAAAGCSSDKRRVVEESLTLGDVVDVVLECAANSREATAVIDDLLATGRIRLTGDR